MQRFPLGASAALLLLVAGTAQASGGGGGGMMSGGTPSQTMPSYDPAVEYQTGVTALNAGRFKDAARAFEHVTEVDPKEANTWYLLGLARAGANDEKGAARALERSVKLDPDNAEAHKALGIAYAHLKKTDKAQAQLGILQAKVSACADTCSEAAALKADVAGLQAALGDAPAPAASLSPSSSLLFADSARGDAAYDKAVSLINARRWSEAARALAASEAAFGPHPDILTWRGYVARRQGDWTAAQRWYQEALTIDPAHRGALEYYGELKVLRRDMAGARSLLARLDAACPFGCAEADELRRWLDHPQALAEADR